MNLEKFYSYKLIDLKIFSKSKLNKSAKKKLKSKSLKMTSFLSSNEKSYTIRTT